MGILNVGTQALAANLAALQTAGNNIANVNTAGYSRQRVVLQNEPGQFTGGGYIGKGVYVQTIQRNFDAFLSRQATMTSATQASDQIRAEKLNLLGDLFQGGTDGVGAAISDMLNSFADIASAPTDLTARTVALTRVDETATRLRSLSTSLDDLQAGIDQPLTEMMAKVNTLATQIADINGEISKALGGGQPPNDLLDQRDKLIKDLNQFVQTSSIPADDGTIGLFIGGSQALVLGTTASSVSLGTDDYNDPAISKLVINRSGAKVTMEESMLGGGQIPGLLRFKNTDMAEARNLLGRLTYAVTSAMNEQHHLGLDLDGNPGGDLFSPIAINTSANVLSDKDNAVTSGTLDLAVRDRTQLAASDYRVTFSSDNTGPTVTGTVTRLSDGKVTAFNSATAPFLATVDGLDISLTGAVAVGDNFMIKPYINSASNVTSQFSSPRALAVASPVAVAANSANKGSLTVSSLLAQNFSTPLATTYAIEFTVAAGVTTYNIYDEVADPTHLTSLQTGPYVPGQAITPSATMIPVTQSSWSITLTGAASNGDRMLVKPNPYPALSGGNATAMMNLRDVAMFDGAALTDGYAGAIAQLGIRSQSANYSAQVSTNLAQNAEAARASISGVNLDEEAAKLLQYQQAYQASAKMIQIAQSIFDTLIQGLGR